MECINIVFTIEGKYKLFRLSYVVSLSCIWSTLMDRGKDSNIPMTIQRYFSPLIAWRSSSDSTFRISRSWTSSRIITSYWWNQSPTSLISEAGMVSTFGNSSRIDGMARIVNVRLLKRAKIWNELWLQRNSDVFHFIYPNSLHLDFYLDAVENTGTVLNKETFAERYARDCFLQTKTTSVWPVEMHLYAS